MKPEWISEAAYKGLIEGLTKELYKQFVGKRLDAFPFDDQSDVTKKYWTEESTYAIDWMLEQFQKAEMPEDVPQTDYAAEADNYFDEGYKRCLAELEFKYPNGLLTWKEG